MRLLLLTALCSLALVSRAAAQGDGHWIIIPSSNSEDTAWVEPTVAGVRRALVGQGAEVWSEGEASKRFEAQGSAPPATLSDADLARWSSLSDGAVNDLAEGDYEKALEKLNAAQNISRAAIEELNREPERARRVFDSCLYVVRATLQTESEARARSVARECRRLVPRAEPSPYMHPPAVTDLLNEIDRLQSKQSGEVRVESVPSGCAARLNGVLLGETPVSIGDLFPGEYRVQVECDPEERGRVHPVAVGAGRAQRSVDARFDSVVRSRPTLLLQYPNATEARRQRRADARTIAREVRTASIVLVSMENGVVELERIDPRDAETSSLAVARISGAGARTVPKGADLTLAAAALVAGDCTDFSSGRPAEIECGRAPAVTPAAAPLAGRPERRRPRGQFIAGMTLLGAGIAGLATGYALLIPRAGDGEDWVGTVDTDVENGATEPSDTSAQQRWLNLRGGIIASASVGAAALVTAMPLALPERDKTPWWAWMSGGIGLGLGAFSIAYGVTAPADPPASCDSATIDPTVPRACIDRSEQTTVALLTGLTAAPLVTMPLVYLFRPNRAKVEPQVRLGNGQAYLGVAGRF
jgi:hypothetical protein